MTTEMKGCEQQKEVNIDELCESIEKLDVHEEITVENEEITVENEEITVENEDLLSLKKENEKLKEENEKLKEENEKLKEENEKLKEENEKLKEKKYISSGLNTPNEIMKELIELQILKEKKNTQWNDSEYVSVNQLKANNVGIIGEEFVSSCCKKVSISALIDGSKTKKKGGGEGDGNIKEKTTEIKTARIGLSRTFQHELGEHPWKAEYILLVDITPNKIYLTIIKNFTEEHYQMPSRKATPYFNKTITRRKENSQNEAGAFKLTLSKQDLEESVSKGHTFKITKETNFKSIGEFINKQIL